MADSEALELIAEYVKVNDELREKMKADSADRARLDGKMSLLRKELDRAEGALVSTKEAKEAFINGLEQDLKRLRTNLDAERQSTSRLERRIEGLDSDLRDANSALDDARSEVDTLTASLGKESRSLQEALATIDSLRVQLSVTEEADANGRGECASLRLEVSHCRKAITDLEEQVVVLNEGRQVAVEETAKLQDFVNALERETSSKDDAAREFARSKVLLDRELDEARQEISQLYTEVSDWKQRAINAEDAAQEVQTSATQQAKASNSAHEAEQTALKSALSASQMSVGDLTKQSQAINSELTRSLNENRSLQDEVASLSRTAQDSNRELAAASAQISSLRSSITTLEATVDTLRTEVADKERAMLGLTTEYESSLTSFREHYSAKMGELSDKNEQLEMRLQTEVDDLHGKLVATQHVAEQIEDLQGKLQRQEQEHVEEVTGMANTRQELLATVSRLRDERRTLQLANSEVTQSLKEIGEFEAELREKYGRLRKAYDDRIVADGEKIRLLMEERDDVNRSYQTSADKLYTLGVKYRDLKAKKEALGETTCDQSKREEELRSTILLQNRHLSAVRGAFEQLRSTNAVITKENEMIRKHTFKIRNGKVQDLNTLEGPRRHPKRFPDFQ